MASVPLGIRESLVRVHCTWSGSLPHQGNQDQSNAILEGVTSQFHALGGWRKRALGSQVGGLTCRGSD